MRDRVILALDVSADRALQFVRDLHQTIRWYKVGLELYLSEGPSIMSRLAELGVNVFLDLKLHDIPNTVMRSTFAISKLGANMITVHVSGGSEMLKAAVEGAARAESQGFKRPLILGVTVLTSLNAEVLSRELGMSRSLEAQVLTGAELAKAAGLDGVIASPWEVKAIKQHCGDDFLVITPGIRPAWANNPGDQVRVATPLEAFNAGADFIVVGRPITASDDPISAARRLLEEVPDCRTKEPLGSATKARTNEKGK